MESTPLTVKMLLDKLMQLESKGYGNLEIINYEGFNLFDVEVEHSYSGDIVVIN